MSASAGPRASLFTTRLGSFGELAIAAFLVAAASGVLLAVPYDPADAYGSLATLLLANPAGAFVRNLHYWAGQWCFVATLLHAADHLRAGTERRVQPGVWARLVLALAAMAFVMVSGFLLRGDADAGQALRILFEATDRIPLVGRDLATLVFGPRGALDTVYVQHAGTATILVWLFTIEHSRRLWPRKPAFLAVLAGVSLVSLFLSPGLHDGSDPVIKGPWFFLGVQELLHWTSRPAIVIAGTAAVLVALYAVRVADLDGARRLKALLAALAVAYALLCAVGALLRGEDWTFQPHWPGGAGNLRAGWVFAAAGTTVPLPLPVALGRPEGCLTCHAGVSGLGDAHRPEAVGCASCHGGDTLSLDAGRAHAGMERIPGNLATATRGCGQSDCHRPIVERVNQSLMATMAGVIAVNRAVFGEPDSGRPAHVGSLRDSPADSHLRQLCASCHLGAAKTTFGPNTEGSRGGGCNACHLTYSQENLQALAAYTEARQAGDAEAPRSHPSLGLDIGNGQCLGCHSRSGRISTNYEGWHEMHEPSADVRNAARPASAGPDRFRLFEDGRIFERAMPDVHAAAGMDCIDCHTPNEVMGNGSTHGRKHEALRVTCGDCHPPAGTALKPVPDEHLDPESLRLIALRGWTTGGTESRVRARSGETLVNVVVDGSGTAQLIRKRTGERLPLAPAAPVCSEGGGHARLGCGSCHTAWAPRCSTCHTSFDPQETGYDWAADAEVAGAWIERAGPFVAGPPTLGLREGGGAQGAAVVETFVPGMVMTLDRSRGSPTPDILHTRLYARVEPHTTQRAVRSCVSCHADPEALGFGRGTLELRRDAPGRGHWTFTPGEAVSPADGLPADAWVPFLGTGSGTVSTREDVRPFSVEEHQRVLAVGACLTCHAGDSAPMRDAVRDWDRVMAGRTRACIVPAW